MACVVKAELQARISEDARVRTMSWWHALPAASYLRTRPMSMQCEYKTHSRRWRFPLAAMN